MKDFFLAVLSLVWAVLLLASFIGGLIRFGEWWSSWNLVVKAAGA